MRYARKTPFSLGVYLSRKRFQTVGRLGPLCFHVIQCFESSLQVVGPRARRTGTLGEVYLLADVGYFGEHQRTPVISGEPSHLRIFATSSAVSNSGSLETSSHHPL